MKKWKTLLLSLAGIAGAVLMLHAAEKSPAQSKQTMVTFKVNIHCAACQATLEKHIPFEKGVIDMKTDLLKQTVQITYHAGKTNEAALKSAIEKLGYKVIKNEK